MAKRNSREFLSLTFSVNARICSEADFSANSRIIVKKLELRTNIFTKIHLVISVEIPRKMAVNTELICYTPDCQF